MIDDLHISGQALVQAVVALDPDIGLVHYAGKLDRGSEALELAGSVGNYADRLPGPLLLADQHHHVVVGVGEVLVVGEVSLPALGAIFAQGLQVVVVGLLHGTVYGELVVALAVDLPFKLVDPLAVDLELVVVVPGSHIDSGLVADLALGLQFDALSPVVPIAENLDILQGVARFV